MNLMEAMAAYMQRQMDPNYTRVQAELYNMRNKGKKDPLYGLPYIGSDTQGQTIPQMMDGSQRWQDLFAQGNKADRDLDFALRHPMGPDGMNTLMEMLRRKNMMNMMSNIKRGGGV